MPEDRILVATENLRKAIRSLRKAHSPDRYDRLRAIADASLATFYASASLDEEHRRQLDELRQLINNTEKIGGTDGGD